jgi:hypothetical protein
VGDEHGRGDDEAVDQHQHAALGGAEDGARHHGDLEAAILHQHLQRVVWSTTALQRLGEHAALAEQAGVVQAGAAAGDGIELGVVLGAHQTVGEQRGRRGVADTHLAQADAVAAVVGERMGDAAPALERCVALRGAHGRLFDVVGRAGRDLGVDQPRALAEVVVDAGIDHGEIQPELAGEYVDRRAAGEEVLHHLPGHVLRVGGHAGTRRAVVAGEDDDVRLAQFGFQGLLQQRDLVRERLQAAERAARLGLAVDLVLDRGGEQRVGRGDGVGLHAAGGGGGVEGRGDGRRVGGVRVRQVAIEVGERELEVEGGQGEAGRFSARLAQHPAPVLAAGEALDVGTVLRQEEHGLQPRKAAIGGELVAAVIGLGRGRQHLGDEDRVFLDLAAGAVGVGAGDEDVGVEEVVRFGQAQTDVGHEDVAARVLQPDPQSHVHVSGHDVMHVRPPPPS